MVFNALQNKFEIDTHWLGFYRRLQFFFLSILFFCCATYYIFLRGAITESFEIYFVCFLVATARIYFLGVRSEIRSDKIKIKDLFLILGLFLAIIFTRFLLRKYFPLNPDELQHHDFFSSTASVFTRASSHQQMPFAYIVSYLNVKILGYTEFGIRAYNFVLGGLAIVVFYSGLRIFKISHLIALFSSIGLALAPVVFQYGIVSRPISFGMCFAGFIIFEFLYRLNLGKICLRSSGLIFSLCALMLLSIGFQGPVLILTLALFCFFISIFNQGLAFRLLASISTALILFLPIQYYTFNHADRYLRSTPLDQNFIQRFVESIWHRSMTVLTVKDFAVLGIFILLILFVHFFGRNNHKAMLSFYKLDFFLIVGGVIFCTLMLIITHAVFSYKINVYFSERYLALVHIPIYLTLIFVIQIIKKTIWNFKGQKRTIKKILMASVFFCASSFLYYKQAYPNLEETETKVNGIRSAITDLASTFTDEDTLIPLCHSEHLCWEYPHWFFFIKKNGFDVNEKLKDPILTALESNNFEEKGRVFIYADSEFCDLEHLKEFSSFSFGSNRNVLLYSFEGDQKWNRVNDLIKKFRIYSKRKAPDQAYVVADYFISKALKKEFKWDQSKLPVNYAWELLSLDRFLNSKEINTK